MKSLQKKHIHYISFAKNNKYFTDGRSNQRRRLCSESKRSVTRSDTEHAYDLQECKIWLTELR